MDNLKFGSFIAELRKEKNMTQKELADRLHVTDKAVSKWETGKGFPDLKLMEPLAEELGVSLVELLQGRRQQTGTMTVAEAGLVVAQAMDQSQRSAARNYLRLFRWALTGVGGACTLPLVLSLATRLRNGIALFRMEDSIIGGADGPTAILVSTTPPPPAWLFPAVLAAIVAACVVLAVKVWQVEKKLK